MKPSILIPALGILTASLATADPGAKGDGKRDGRKPPAEAIEKFDTDKDGELNEEERKAMREAMRKRMLERFDTDKDGTLSDEEKAAMKEQMKARHQELLDKYDTDKDGKLSPEERKAARDAGEQIPPRGRPDGDRKPANRDGGKPAKRPADAN